MDNDKFIKFGVGIIVLFLVGVFLRLAKPVLVPFFLALFLSFAIAPVLDFLVRRKIPKSVALTAILLVMFALFYLVGALFFSSGKTMAADLPSFNDMIKSVLAGVDQTIKNPRLKTDIMNWINGLNAERVGPLIISVLGTFFSFTSELLVVFVFMMFILAGRGRMEKKVVLAFSPEQATTVTRAVRRIDHEVQKYLAVKSLVNLVVGGLTAAITALFGLPFALVFGVLTFILNYIPNFGSIIATVLPVLLAGFFFPTLGRAIGLVIVLMAMHMAVGNIFEPKLMGKGLALSPLLVIFALFFWGWLWGIPGMILAIPILAVVKIILGNIPSLKFLEALMD